MKKITLILFVIIAEFFGNYLNAQHSFTAVAGPTLVAQGTPVTLNVNDAGNTAAVPASSTGSYGTFSVSVEWAANAGGPYSSEADLTMITTAGSVLIDPPTTGGMASEANTTLTFVGEFTSPYNPQTDGMLDIRLRQSWSGSSANWSNIVVTIYESPSCIDPTTLATSNITTSSVDLSWVDPSGNQFDFEYVVQAAGAGEPTGAGVAISDFSVTGESVDINGNPLVSATAYEVWVRADCGAGDYSAWVGPVNFSTLCNVLPIPFMEGFNSDSATQTCWTVLNENADGDSWNMNYTSNPYEGNQVAVLYTDFNTGNNNDWLISPTLTLTGNQRLKFYYRVQSASEPNDFEVLLSTTGITPAAFTNTLVALTSYSNTTYMEQIVDLSAYTGNVNIAWHVPSGGLDGWRIYIDKVVVEDIPLTVPPCATNIVATPDTACGNFANVITWDATAGADGYYLTIGTTTGGTDVLNNQNLGNALTYTFTGTINTTYYYKVVPFNAVGSADSCDEMSFTTVATGCYCTSAPTSVDGSGITNVQLGTTDFPNTLSTAPVYNDHTATAVDLMQGVNSNVQVSLNTGFGYTYSIVIWIDANDDYNFDASEIVLTAETTNTAIQTYNASFIMPASIPLGNHRMRIVATDNVQNPSNPCYSGTWGETADFTVNIIAASCTPVTIASSTIVPDCTNEEFSVDIDVTSLGDATASSISDGTNSWPITATGVVPVGPFMNGSSVTLTALHGSDTTCDLPLGTFTYTCPPANDECDGAIQLTVNADLACGTVTSGTIASATPSGIDEAACGGTEDDDVWFSFVATSTSHQISLINVAGSTTDLYHSLWTGADCSSLALVSGTCSDPNTSSPSNLTIGVTYYVRVYSWTATAGQTSSFDICIGTPPPPPANDACADAIEVTSLPYSNSQDATSATNNDGFITTCDSMNDGVWYTVVGDGADITISVTDTGWDSQIGVYTGTCGTFTCVGYADDGGLSGGESYTISGSVVGTLYYINIGQWSGTTNNSEGSLVINITTTLATSQFNTNSFVAYPNPVKDALNLQYSSEITAVQVVNMLGQQVLSKTIGANSTQIDMSDLNAGTYIVNVTINDVKKSIKVVKQ